jgi:DNA-directed RNA polymerase specialized sigma subunit
MIRNENEYQVAVGRLRDEAARLAEQERVLREKGLTDEQLKNALDPMRSFHLQLKEEVEAYERLRRGEFDLLHNLGGLGRLLVSLRVFKGVSQRELAERLGVHESQVSRDERNEYRGVTLERAGRVLEALGAELTTTVQAAAGQEIAA